LTTTADGVVVVVGTRVSLDLIVDTSEQGATAEEIAQRFPTLALADVYDVIAYYLRHRDDVGVYLDQRNQRREEARRENERRFDQSGIRARLLARQESAE